MCDKSTTRVSKRALMAYQLREQGLKFKEVGAKLGASACRARQLYCLAKWWLEREPHWTDGLNVRAANALLNSGIKSRDETLAAFKTGTLHLGIGGPRNYGIKSHKEVAKWLGLPEPQ